MQTVNGHLNNMAQPDFSTLKEVQPDFSTLKEVAPTAAPVDNRSLGDKIWGGLVGATKAVGNALTSSEQEFGKDIAGAIIPHTEAQQKIEKARQLEQDTTQALVKHIQDLKAQGKDTSHAIETLKGIMEGGSSVQTDEQFNPAITKTGGEVIGDAAGVALDIASAGSYGAGAKGAKTGTLLTKEANLAARGAEAAKIAATAKNIEVGTKFGTQFLTEGGKPALSETLKEIGKKTVERAAVGAGTGYAYDVAGNLQEGKTGTEALKPGMGALTGGAVPVLIGGVQAGVAITKDTAPRFINSLIKPRQADFSYGKDPGRTVSEMGITGNNLPDFADNIRTAKNDIGREIGSIYSSPQNAGLAINAEDQISKIDDAIKEAAKGGKSNQAMVTTLQNIKDGLLYEHQVNADGVIEKVGTTPRDLSKLTPQEAFDLKKLVAEQTKFTGNPSDDKKVNTVLQNIYGSLKEKLNETVGVNNPEIKDLNQKFADLTSAEIATVHRNDIVRRADQISMPAKVGIGTGLATLVGTGGAIVPAAVIGLGAVGLDKALQSTAVKTRVAAWLGSESPSVITKMFKEHPEIATVLYRLLPKEASRFGKAPESKIQNK